MGEGKNSSVGSGFKFAFGVVLFFVVFFWLFRPGVVVGPVDSDGNIVVPKGTTDGVVYSSVPLKEDVEVESEKRADIETMNLGKVANEEGNNLDVFGNINDPTEQSEELSGKQPTIKINEIQLVNQIGQIPEEYLSLYEHAESGTKEIFKSTYVSVSEEGEIFLILDVTINNSDSEEFDVNPHFMKLKDEKGYIYQHSSETYNMENYFDGTTLDKGELLSGRIVFEIPDDIKRFNFILETFSSSVSVVIVLP